MTVISDPVQGVSCLRASVNAPADECARELAADSTRLPIIDVARGTAALMVCALHAREIVWVGLRACLSQRNSQPALQTVLGLLSAPLVLGGCAVPLFFVISGYCIHRSFAAKLTVDRNHEPNWRSYFIRRAWRIYPVLIAVLLITLLLDPFTAHRYPQDPKLGSLSPKTMLINLCALQGVAGPPFGSNGPLWTLSLEMQLYALYPVVFYVTKRHGMKASLAVTFVFSMACVALGLFPAFQSLAWFGPFWFSWVLGCAIAEIETSKTKVILGPFKFIGWLLVSSLGFSLELSRFGTFAFSCAACFWSLIILKCLQSKAASPSFLPLASLTKVGLISYSLYAVHKPVLLFARSLFLHGAPTTNILYVPVAMAGCVLVAAVLFLLVERYSLRLPNWLRSIADS